MRTEEQHYTLVWSTFFVRTAKRFLKRHPEMRGVFSDVLHKLECNPQDPELRLHSLRGKLAGRQAVSLTYSYRIVLTLEVAEREIILLDVGSHDEVYG